MHCTSGGNRQLLRLALPSPRVAREGWAHLPGSSRFVVDDPTTRRFPSSPRLGMPHKRDTPRPTELSQPATHKVAAARGFGDVSATSDHHLFCTWPRHTHSSEILTPQSRDMCGWDAMHHVRRYFSRPEQTPPCDPPLSHGSTRFEVDDQRTRGFGAPLGEVTVITGCQQSAKRSSTPQWSVLDL